MVHKASVAWKLALAFLLAAAVVFAAPAMGAHAWAADHNPIAGLKEAKVAVADSTPSCSARGRAAPH